MDADIRGLEDIPTQSRHGAKNFARRDAEGAEKGKGGLELPPSQRERGVASKSFGSNIAAGIICGARQSAATGSVEALRLETDRARGPTLHHRGRAATLQSEIRNRQFAIRNVMGGIIAWVGKSTLRTVGSIFWSKIGGWTSIKPL